MLKIGHALRSYFYVAFIFDKHNKGVRLIEQILPDESAACSDIFSPLLITFNSLDESIIFIGPVRDQLTEVDCITICYIGIQL